MNFVMSPAHLLNALPLWLSGRALDPRISRYKVQFNIGIQNFFFVTRL